MSLSSMTGYARLNATFGGQDILWEVKSVNNRGLDIRCRLPQSLDRLEPRLREAVAQMFKRGSISISIQVTAQTETTLYHINDAELDRYGRAALAAAARLGLKPPRIEGLMPLPGVIVRGPAEVQASPEADPAAADTAHFAAFTTLLDALKASRDGEGARLGLVLAGHVDDIERLVMAAEAAAATQPASLRARLVAQIEDVLGRREGVDPERLAQEVALLAVKADIREELDRLQAHVAEARHLLASGDAVGRRLDFLSQEFNREANTLCSKSSDIPLTRIGLDLKTVIDRLREQIQNIE